MNDAASGSAIAIRARGLTKRFGSLVAVDHVDLTVHKAAVYGFLGPNGSGKSTTIRMLCGLLTPDAGDIEVLGLSIPRETEALRLRIGYMTQKFSLFDDLTVRENLEFLAAVHGLSKRETKERVDAVIARYHFQRREKQLASTLSGGLRQHLALAAAVVHEPELLFLDEPTSAVDPESRRQFWERLFELADAGTTILVSTHYMDEAERCHALAILDHGRLVANGPPAELMDALSGRTFEVRAARPREAHDALIGVPGVISVAQIGTTLRVLAAEGASIEPELARALEGCAGAELAATPPSLEDVFVSATHERPEERAA